MADRSQRESKISDLLLAAAGEAVKLTALHYDSDFALIAGVSGQRMTWVMPAGEGD